MNHSCANQRRDNGRWDYTTNGRAVGYCVPFSFALIPDGSTFLPAEAVKKWNDQIRPLESKFHDDGHATEEEACECYKQYILDTRLRLQPTEPENASQQNRCQVCKAFTACHAMVGAYRMFTLCPIHQTREEVEKLLKVGESWES